MWVHLSRFLLGVEKGLSENGENKPFMRQLCVVLASCGLQTGIASETGASGGGLSNQTYRSVAGFHLKPGLMVTLSQRVVSFIVCLICLLLLNF